MRSEHLRVSVWQDLKGDQNMICDKFRPRQQSTVRFLVQLTKSKVKTKTRFEKKQTIELTEIFKKGLE